MFFLFWKAEEEGVNFTPSAVNTIEPFFFIYFEKKNLWKDTKSLVISSEGTITKVPENAQTMASNTWK